MFFLFIAAGLALLTIGAEFLVRGAAALARRFGLSELLIGLTLVGFGTSTPELVSSIEAALSGAPDIAVGNVVGSNIANILLILGLSAAIAPVAVEPKAFRRDALALAGGTIIVVAVASGGEVGRLAGALFLIGLAAYIAYAYVTDAGAPSAPETERHEHEAAAIPDEAALSIPRSIFYAALGLFLLAVGAKLLVGGAVTAAAILGVSETVIGLTVVAIGTSLPELFTSVIAARRGKSDLALGNVVGSNLYNILGILGATALVKPVSVSAQIIAIDNWVMVAATAVMILFAASRHRIGRWEGAVLAAAYAAYLGWLAFSAG